MNKRDIEKQLKMELKEASGNLKPPVILTETIETEKSAKDVLAIKRKKGIAVSIVCFISAVIVVLSLIFSSLFYVSDLSAFLVIDINPSIQFKTDSKGKVIAFSALNKDARALLLHSKVDFKGLSATEAASKAVNLATAYGYFTPAASTNAMLITVNGAEIKSENSLKKSMTESAKKEMEKLGLYGVIITSKKPSKATDGNISLSKLNLLEEANSLKAGLVSESEFESISITEIYSRMESAAAAIGEFSDDDFLFEFTDEIENILERTVEVIEEFTDLVEEISEDGEEDDDEPEDEDNLEKIYEKLEKDSKKERIKKQLEIMEKTTEELEDSENVSEAYKHLSAIEKCLETIESEKETAFIEPIALIKDEMALTKNKLNELENRVKKDKETSYNLIDDKNKTNNGNLNNKPSPDYKKNQKALEKEKSKLYEDNWESLKKEWSLLFGIN